MLSSVKDVAEDSTNDVTEAEAALNPEETNARVVSVIFYFRRFVFLLAFCILAIDIGILQLCGFHASNFGFLFYFVDLFLFLVAIQFLKCLRWYCTRIFNTTRTCK